MVQGTAIALKFEGQEEVYEAKTRKEALHSVLSGESLTARHDHVVSPLVHNAANHLTQNKRTLDIELYGFPYEVLEQATEQLDGAGISSKMANQLIAALEEYILNMGTVFSREAKAKPLYARFKVTDHEPEGLPDCEQSQATFLAGMKSYGGDAARQIRYMSIYGPKSTSSQGVDMETMFVSKNMGLFVFFGAPSNEAVKGFNGIDNALMNAMQGMGGGAMSEEAMAELIDTIKNGDLSPEALELLENMAALAELTDTALTPDAIENVEEQIANLTQEISEQIAQGIESGALPQAMISASIQILTEASPNNVLSSILDNAVAQDISAGNDNPDVTAEIEALIEQLTELSNSEGLDQASIDAIMSQIEALNAALSSDGSDLSSILAEIKTELSALASTEGWSDAVYEQISEILPAVSELSQGIEVPASLFDQLPELAELGAEELLEILQELAKTENLPPELQELLDQIDIDNLTPETLAEALSAKADTELAQSVQALVVALNNPEVQSLLPQDVLVHVNQFLDNHDALVEAVSTHVVVQNIETILEAGDLDASQVQELQNIVEDLKSGVETISTIEPSVLQAVAPQLDTATFAALENAITTMDAAKTDNVILTDHMVEILNNIVQSSDLTVRAQADLTRALETGNKDVVLTVLANNSDIIQRAPENVRAEISAIIAQSQSNTPSVSPEIARSQVVFAQAQATVISTKPDFPTPAVVQSLTLIAQDVKQAGNPAQAELLKASANIVDKFEGKGVEPTVKDIVETVQKINEVIQKNEASAEKMTPAQQAELAVVKDKLIETLPADIKNDLKPALEQVFSKNDNLNVQGGGHKQNNVQNLLENIKGVDAKIIAEIKPTFTGCADCAGCNGCDTNVEQNATKEDNNSHDGDYSRQEASLDSNSDVNNVQQIYSSLEQGAVTGFGVDTALNTSNVISLGGGAIKVTAQDLFQGIKGIDATAIAEIKPTFTGCADCAGCNGCDTDAKPSKTVKALAPKQGLG